ncbi:MAG: hypothetical protein IPM54_21610 [Polyangiaceae bacterium]|nr:hypothetical protein [Polyangiaceae bacterium]
MRPRSALSLIFAFALSQAVMSCGPGPTIVSGPQSASFGEPGGKAQAPPAAIPVVDVRWEEQPVEVRLAVATSERAAPATLTSPDGVGLEIASMAVSGVVQDPLAFTELRFTFKNPDARTIEGRFEVVLPPGATISRFAMRNADGWQEGEVVEQQAARAAYEDFLHRRADPALLEKQAGNRFQARVFPIPASGEKEIILSYSQKLSSGADPYRVHLRGLPSVKQFDLRVIDGRALAKRKAFTSRQANFKPDRDFVLPIGTDKSLAVGLRHEELAVARVTPVAEDRPDPVHDLLVLLDTSASRALDLKTQANQLAALLAAMPDDISSDMSLAVACFDQELEPIYVGSRRNFGAKEIEAILKRKALGASDLGLALESAASFVKKQSGKFTRVLLFTDGIPTAGAVEAVDIAKELQDLRDAGVRRIDAVVAGGIRDENLLRKLTKGTLPKDGIVLDADLPSSEMASRLNRATVSNLRVRVPGAKFVWPEKLDGMLPRDEALVFAELPKGAPFEVEIEGPSGKVKRVVATEFAEKPLLERAIVGARIERLTDERDATDKEERRAEIAREIVSLSTQFRVLSDFTALLVLESDQDYARFGIDRRALADILVVGPAGIELQKRTAGPVAIAQPSPVEDRKLPKEKEKGGDKKADMAGGAAPGNAAPSTPPADTALEAPPPPAQAALSRDELREEARPAPMAEPEPEAPRPAPRPAATAMAPRPPSKAGAPATKPSQAASGGGSTASSRPWRPPPPPPPPPPRRIVEREQFEDDDNDGDDEDSPQDTGVAPYEGKFANVMALIEKKRTADAIAFASDYRDADPGDALALVALGEAFEAAGDKDQAARAFGSIIDLFPGRADLRRFAGARLERFAKPGDAAHWLVVDTYRKAVASRPDHPSGARMLAYALARAGYFEEALDTVIAAFVRRYPSGRFAGVRRVLSDDVGILAAAFVKARPERRAEVEKRLAEIGARISNKPSLRFVLVWETDANDVDFHIRDGRGGHAYYSRRKLRSGGELYADVTTGYGPECFAIDGRATAYPYRLQAHYYSRGPMGYGMGKLQIVEHDGAGTIKLEERPFVVMTDRAFVNLGVVTGPLKAQ